jgi:hypothetical protein
MSNYSHLLSRGRSRGNDERGLYYDNSFGSLNQWEVK